MVVHFSFHRFFIVMLSPSFVPGCCEDAEVAPEVRVRADHELRVEEEEPGKRRREEIETTIEEKRYLYIYYNTIDFITIIEEKHR